MGTTIAMFDTSRIMQRKKFGHWVAGNRPRFANRWSVFDMLIGFIETAGRRRAGERASCVASLGCPGFKGAEQSSAYSSKPCIRRNVVKSDFPSVGDRTDGKDFAVLDSNEHRVCGLTNPRPKEFGSLIPQPLPQNTGIASVVGVAKLCYRPP
jgi:hypothetical protein